MKTHLYGTSPYIPDAAYLSGDELSRQTGSNTGNLMFGHSLFRMTGTSPKNIPWGTSMAHLDPKQDILVMPLANQLGPHVDLNQLAEKLKNIELPIVGIGLGAQGSISGVDEKSIPDGSWKWLRTMQSHSISDYPNIALRGEETLRAIATQGLDEKCVVTGCPSNFLNPSSTLGREISRRSANDIRRIAVPAGNPFLPQFKKLEQSLRSLVEATGGTYICQHPIDMLRLFKGEYNLISKKNFDKYREYIHPKLDDDSFIEWFRRYSYSFASVPEWMTMMSRHDLVVGTRIHGVMAGLQAGVPSVCLCIDSRTKELCQTMKIPHADANDYRNGVTVDELVEIIKKWDGRSYDDNRRILGFRLSDFLHKNGIEPQGAIREVLTPRSSQVAVPIECQVEFPHQPNTRSSSDRYRSIFSALAGLVSIPNPTILSFGCADGFETHDLSTKYFHHARIVGCDIDSEALRIARLCNQQPHRVSFSESSSDSLAELGPYDVIVAMSVLCRWPETRNMDDISTIYPFERFSSQIDAFVDLLKPGGILCVYNSNYCVSDTSAMSRLELIEVTDLLPRTQPVKRFDSNCHPLSEDKLDGIIFRKRVDI